MATLALLAVFVLAALAGGVLIGRYYAPDDRGQKRAVRHGRSYLRALNFVLSRDNDRAVEELKGVVRDDVGDVEPYFALGALFRSRGEYERAIRVHQAIELRAGEDRRVALRGRYELGLDFRAADMPRRATRAMEDCLAEDPEHAGALRALCGLYEEQGRYAEAALAWQRLSRDGVPDGGRSAHLWAEAARRALEERDFDYAARALESARALAPESPHVLGVAAFIARAQGEPDEAKELVVAALIQAPELAGVFVPQLFEIEAALASAPPEVGELPPGDEEIAELAAKATIDTVTRIIDDIGDEPHLLLARAELTARVDPEEAGEEYQRAAIRLPDLLPARVERARLALDSGEAAAIESELTALAGEEGALDWVLAGIWRCRRCGHVQNDFTWRCSSCRQWAEVRRVIGRSAYDPPPAEARDRRAVPRYRPPLLESAYGLRGAGAGDDDSLIDRAGALISGVWRSVRRGPRADRD